MSKPQIDAFFDQQTNTVTYLVSDPETGFCAVIDPVLGYDGSAGRVNQSSIDALLETIASKKLSLQWILETHVHADHLTGAHVLRDKTGAKIGIGARVVEVQQGFADTFLQTNGNNDGTQFDRLFEDNESFSIGNLTVTVLATPGHTPACVSYWVGNAVFVGDTLFMPDFGTARTDFPGGSAETLYHSIHRLFELPDETRVFTGHDYKSSQRDEFAWESTIAIQKRDNIHINTDVGLKDFVHRRESRDQCLKVPALLLPALQVNLRAGELPPKADNGVAYLKIPLDVF